MRRILGLIGWIGAWLSLVWLIPICLLSRRRVTDWRELRLVWGPVPIISNKYWSEAMRGAGLSSTTLMQDIYSRINRRSDFDILIADLAPFRQRQLRQVWRRLLEPYVVFAHAVRRYDVFHHPVSGGYLGTTPLWRLEAWMLRLAGKKIIILPYGGDAYAYSTIADLSLRHALLSSYPDAAKHDSRIRRRIQYWSRNADVMIPTLMTDGMPRWDVVVPSYVAIDASLWKPAQRARPGDGRVNVVRIAHTPNHRGFKGTEFLIQAVEVLRSEGLKVELLLVEGVQNEEVRRILQHEADILAEQFIAVGYALSAIEGMAAGLPVLANLDDERYTRIFRRFSFLDECPIVSTPPERLVENLRRLVTDPRVRLDLGRAGRAYVEKYHSFDAARRLFENVYRCLLGEEIALLDLYHPVKGSGRSLPHVEHPLVESRLSDAEEQVDAAVSVHD